MTHPEKNRDESEDHISGFLSPFFSPMANGEISRMFNHKMKEKTISFPE